MMLHNVVDLMTIQFNDTIFCGLSEVLIMIFRKKICLKVVLHFFMERRHSSVEVLQ